MGLSEIGQLVKERTSSMGWTGGTVSNLDYGLNELSKRVANVSAEKVEMLAAAFLKETNLKPSECELVMEYTHDSKIIWYFRKRER